MNLYSTVIRPLAFRLDPERAHHLAVTIAASLGWAAGPMRAITMVDDARLKTRVAGLDFPTPIGLAAGFCFALLAATSRSTTAHSLRQRNRSAGNVAAVHPSRQR
jgi:hypothetical protein